MNILAPIDWPNSAAAMPRALMKWVLSGPASATMVRWSRSLGSEKSALRVNSPGRNSAVLTTIAVAPCFTAARILRVPATTMSPPRHRSARPEASPRAPFLPQPRHVEHADAPALQMRRHAENAADGDDAGAADAGDDDVVGLADRRQGRLRQRRRVIEGGDGGALLELGAVHSDKRR